MYYLARRKPKTEVRNGRFNDTRHNPSKVCYFTGLPSIAVLQAVFDLVSTCVSTSRSILPPFQQFVMVLMKLCLNVDNELLSSIFRVHASTVSRYFQKWINVCMKE